MKKLSLLKPDLRTVYLENGKGQEVNYIQISKNINKKALERDIKYGAVPFKECLELVNKKSYRVVLIDCENEEEGLMAATYLAGIYNWKDNVYENMDCEEDEEEFFYNKIGNSKDYELSDYEKIDEFFLDDLDTYDDEAWTAYTLEESPCRMPVIELSSITSYIDSGISSIGRDNYSYGGVRNFNNEKPYWLTVREENVCIIVKNNMFDLNVFLGENQEENIIKALKRFERNRHVFVVMLRETEQKDWIIESENELNYKNQMIFNIVLEYTAGMIKIECEEEDYNKYYQVLFENWASFFGKKLKRGFPKKELVKGIISMENPNKSALIEKIYRYILSEQEINSEKKILCKNDFAIMKKLNMFTSIEKGKEKEKQQEIKKLNTMLVGMEEVKKQVASIVEVMKYNKRRAQMGLNTNGYHNVHLLIGAPGTAKTTIAQMMGNIMCEQKLLPSNRFIAINGADLKGMYVGHSAPKTKRYFEEYDIILIDEAYSIATEKELDSYSQEAIAQLIIELEKHGMDKLVMFAGYGGKKVAEQDNKMKAFLNANPGIRSRINSTIYFDSYTPKEMVEIVHCQAKNQDYYLSHDVDEMIHNYFVERVNLSDFGNGREARSLLENIVKNAATRIMTVSEEKITKKMLQELTYEDVEKALKQMREVYSIQKGQEKRKLGFL